MMEVEDNGDGRSMDYRPWWVKILQSWELEGVSKKQKVMVGDLNTCYGAQNKDFRFLLIEKKKNDKTRSDFFFKKIISPQRINYKWVGGTSNNRRW